MNADEDKFSRDYFVKQGKRGGEIRAQRLSAERREEIAKKAAEALWKARRQAQQ